MFYPPVDGDQYEPELIQDSRHLVIHKSRASSPAVINQRQFSSSFRTIRDRAMREKGKKKARSLPARDRLANL